ncbi:hypothetical protein H2248_007886 [Termitomyces sp. 'cryptogamus']|nr:hypothetical protein H2248_007886 [Termitomyces sp. 'cryptogamus']
MLQSEYPAVFCRNIVDPCTKPPFDSQTEDFNDVKNEILETELEFREDDKVSDFAPDFLSLKCWKNVLKTVDTSPRSKSTRSLLELTGHSWRCTASPLLGSPTLPIRPSSLREIGRWAPGLQELDEVELVDVRFKEAGVKARKLKEAVEVAVKDERCEIGDVVEECEMVEEEYEVRVKEIVVEEEKTSVVRALLQRLWPWLKKR